MMLTLPNLVGDAGVACVLGTYLAAQMGRMDPRGMPFLVTNGVGSGLVLYSLTFDYNQSAFIIQVCWIAISIVGVVRNIISRPGRADKEHQP